MKNMHRQILGLFILTLVLSAVPPAQAVERPNYDIVGITVPALDLFATDQSPEPASQLDAAGVTLPLPVQAVSGNGMLLVKIDGKKYWVDALQVETNEGGLTSGTCGEQVASGTPVPLGIRGLGNGC
ncbi:MAG: hypothetical protein ACOY2B_12230 [Pseudomonadota bacterium]